VPDESGESKEEEENMGDAHATRRGSIWSRAADKVSKKRLILISRTGSSQELAPHYQPSGESTQEEKGNGDIFDWESW